MIGERNEKVNVEVEEQQEEESATVAEHETMVLPRKRKSNPILWKQNVRKLKRMKRDEYINCTEELFKVNVCNLRLAFKRVTTNLAFFFQKIKENCFLTTFINLAALKNNVFYRFQCQSRKHRAFKNQKSTFSASLYLQIFFFSEWPAYKRLKRIFYGNFKGNRRLNSI